MKIHEYQAKEIFVRYGIPINPGYLCHSVDDAINSYEKLDYDLVVVKAQVHTGGRGKAGGVKLAKDTVEMRNHTANILGMNIKGFTVDRILLAKAEDIESEYYVSFVIDRNSKSTLLMLSKEGGVDIEEVAHKTPEKIHKIIIDPTLGMPDFLAREAAFLLFDDIK
ncbi:MAG: acetate--CoA ligase family protein, partial [Dysgonamonadaceae bacterium]|nr:acetate--CoA ligase family protein [Dysgonamonadaceae bacterium]